MKLHFLGLCFSISIFYGEPKIRETRGADLKEKKQPPMIQSTLKDEETKSAELGAPRRVHNMGCFFLFETTINSKATPKSILEQGKINQPYTHLYLEYNTGLVYIYI